MLEYVKSNKLELADDIWDRYPGCKILLSDVNLSDISKVKGCVYAVSHSSETYDLLCREQGVLEAKGRLPMIIGSYGGFGIGLQYVVKK